MAGHLVVAAAEREAYLDGCAAVVSQARDTDGCLDFSLAADLLDPGRINVYERWRSRADVDAFRGNGPSGEQTAAILSASVTEYDVETERSLTG